MKILPVLDLLDGIVVRGVAGKRNAYRPVESQLVDNPDPIFVAEAFRNHFGLTEFYLADLDAILVLPYGPDDARRIRAPNVKILGLAALVSSAAIPFLMSGASGFQVQHESTT